MLSIEMAAIAVQVNISVMLTGLPGIGKTALTRGLATEINMLKYGNTGFPLVITNCAQAAPEELAGAGVPNHETKSMDAYIMGALKPFLQAGGKGLHLLDEYGSAEPPMRAATLNVTEGRVYGETHLPGVAVVCCMNPLSVAVNGIPMKQPESNRFFWIEFEMTKSAHIDYLRGGKGALSHVPIVPKHWDETHLPKANALIASFLERHDSLHYDMPPDDQATGPWPSFRSWEYAGKMLAATRACGYDIYSDHVFQAVRGCVGEPTAKVFFEWLQAMDLPDPEAFFGLKPAEAVKLVPAKKDRAIACLESVAIASYEKQRKPDEIAKRWEHVWNILDIVHEEHEDFAQSAARLLSQNMPKGTDFNPVMAKMLGTRRAVGLSRAS